MHRGERPARIVFIIGSLDVGGTERQLVALARRLDRTRFSPVVACLSAPGPLARELIGDGIPVWTAQLRGRGPFRHPVAFIRELLGLLRRIRAHEPHIIHGMLFHAYVAGAVFARLAGTPVCVASRRSLGRFKEAHRLARLAERLVNRHTNLIIANSEAVRTDAIRQERLNPEKVVVIHNGLDAERYAVPAQPALRRSLAVRDDDLIVGVVANFIHYKGYESFLAAWATVSTRVPKAVAVLVGDGPTRPHIEQRAAELGIAGSLRFVGTRDDVPDLLALMDVVVHPSLEEGLSNAVLEAMAARRPVVATAVGGNPEAVIDGVTGVLVPPADSTELADAILRLLEDAALRVRLGTNAHDHVAAGFALDAMVRQYERVYERLLDDAYRDQMTSAAGAQ